MRLTCEAHNEPPTKSLKRSPVEVFTKSAIVPEPKHWQPFGCPVYVLDNALQNAGGIKHKWEEQSQPVGVSGQVSISCKVCGTGVEPQHWQSVPTVPCAV